MDIVNFGTRLKDVRLSKNITQDELAKLCNTTKQVISRYERGERTPKITVAAEYSEKLGVDLSYLLGENVPMYRETADNKANGLTKEVLSVVEMWQQIPEESQEMVYKMIEAALKSRGL